VDIDPVTLYTIARETSGRLDTLLQRASEAKDLQAAKEFASYLQWSGILRLLESVTPAKNLEFDAAHLRWKHKKLLDLVHEQFTKNAKVVSLEWSQMEALNHKLDLIAAHVSRLPIPASESYANPMLSIVKEDTA
jgi:hypothetical protein